MLLAPHLAGRLPKYIIEPKADLKYPIVGAASNGQSIRDAQLQIIEGDVGSGYPSDPKTRNWQKVFGTQRTIPRLCPYLLGNHRQFHVNKYSFRNNIPVFLSVVFI